MILGALFAAGVIAGKVLVLDAVAVGVPENVSALITERVQAAVEEQQPGVALRRSALSDVLAESAGKLNRTLLKKLESARDAYFAGDSRGAAEELEALQPELEASLLKTADLDPLVDCWRLLAAAQFDARQPERAAPIIARLIRLRPNEPPDVNLYPPSLARAFKRELDLVTTRGAILARSEPSRATVYLDGRLLGAAPQRMPDLMPGVHYVRFEAEGRSAFAAQVQVDGGSETEVVGKLPPTAATGEWAKLNANLSAPGQAPEARKLAAELAAAAGATQAIALVVVAIHNGVYVGAARVESEVVLGRAWTVLTPDLAGAGEAMAQLARALFAPPAVSNTPVRVSAALLDTDPPPDFEGSLLGYGSRANREVDGESFPALAIAPPEPEAPYWREWWFWGGVGALLVGGATVVILATSSDAEVLPPHVQVTLVLP